MTNDFPPDARPTFTKFRSRKRISKSFKWDAKEAKLAKEPGGLLFAGDAVKRRLKDPADLVVLLETATPNDAFCWGVSPFDDASVVTHAKLSDPQNGGRPVIARTRDFFSYPEGAGVMMHDIDPPKDGSAAPLTLDEAIDALVRCCPAVSSTPMVCTSSSSSHIYHGEECKRGAGGYHIYTFVSDASDIIRAGEVLFKRSWLAGYGRIEIGGAGQLLVRSFLDGAVYKPERLDFGMKAHCVKPIEQRHPRPEIRNEGGPLLDTRAALPGLLGDELATYKRLVDEAKKRREADAAPIREAWAHDRVREILRERKTTPEASPEVARKLFDSLRKASAELSLDADMILHTPRGATVTVAEILLDPEKWRGQRFADPLEPNYGNDRRIAVLDERGGKWGIFSHAHGGIRYKLPVMTQDEPEHIEVEVEPEQADTGKDRENAGKETGKKRRFLVYTHENIDTLPDTAWTVKNILPDIGVGALHGESTVGKSFLALDMAAAITEGRAWFGHKTRKRPVAYLVLEGIGGFKKRLRAYEIAHGRKLPNDDMHIIGVDPMEGFDIRNQDHCTELAASLPADCIIIVDTLSQAALGRNENTSEDGGKVLAGARILAGTSRFVLFVAHCGKDQTRGISGWYGFFAALDMNIEVTRQGSGYVWTAKKVKDGMDGVKGHFKRDVVELGEDADGEAITSCVIRPDETVRAEAAPRERMTPTMKTGMESFDACVRALGGGGVRLEEWREYFYAADTADSRDSKKKNFQNARRDLVARDFLEVHDDFYTRKGSTSGKAGKDRETSGNFPG